MCIMHIRSVKNGGKNSIVVIHEQNISVIFLFVCVCDVCLHLFECQGCL